MKSTVATITLFLTCVPALARAQATPPAPALSLTTGLSFTSRWDDETHLGRGVLVSVGVTRPFASRFNWEAELSLARHRRDSGYLEATGTPIVGTGRVAYFFTSPTKSVRPFVSAGLTLTHHRGYFVWKEITLGPDGFPVEGADIRKDWRLTKGGGEIGLGMNIRGKGRMWWRPEVRIGATQGNRDYAPGVDTLEAPILTIRGGLVVGWR